MTHQLSESHHPDRFRKAIGLGERQGGVCAGED